MKKIINSLKKKYRYYKQRIYEFDLCVKEYGANARTTPNEEEISFKNRMLLQVHRVEKGLGLEDCEPGHSSSVAADLEYRLLQYIDLNYDTHDYAFEETFSVLSAYLDYQKKYGNPNWKQLPALEETYQKIVNVIGAEYARKIIDTYKAGAYRINETDVKPNFDFEKFIESRHSMRMFANQKVDEQDVRRIVKLANMAPSACNRQPAKVYFVQDTNKLKQVDHLITGNHGFEGKIPYYIILTENRTQFAGEEQFQWYINGGIYLSYLTLAIHSLGMGSCIMQWKAFHKNEPELKKALGITKNEAIIAVIGCGHYQEESKVICASRKSVTETLTMI